MVFDDVFVPQGERDHPQTPVQLENDRVVAVTCPSSSEPGRLSGTVPAEMWGHPREGAPRPASLCQGMNTVGARGGHSPAPSFDLLFPFPHYFLHQRGWIFDSTGEQFSVYPEDINYTSSRI